MKITVEFDSMSEFLSYMKPKKIEEAQDETKTPIEGLGLTVRTENVLLAAGIKYIEDAQRLGEAGLLRLPNLGRKSATEVMSWPTQKPNPLNEILGSEAMVTFVPHQPDDPS